MINVHILLGILIKYNNNNNYTINEFTLIGSVWSRSFKEDKIGHATDSSITLIFSALFSQFAI